VELTLRTINASGEVEFSDEIFIEAAKTVWGEGEGEEVGSGHITEEVGERTPGSNPEED
jgi:hypothetical protein